MGVSDRPYPLTDSLLLDPEIEDDEETGEDLGTFCQD